MICQPEDQKIRIWGYNLNKMQRIYLSKLPLFFVIMGDC